MKKIIIIYIFTKDPLEWPWIAVLFNGPKQFCGGSLIDDVHILSGQEKNQLND